MRLSLGLYLRDSWSWFKQKSQTRSALWWLAGYSFFESVILPFPTDVFLALMILADRTRTVHLVAVTTLAGVAGAVALYALVRLAYTPLIDPILVWLNAGSAIEHAAASVSGYAFAAVFLGALTPIPYTPVVIAAGILGVDLATLVFASIAGRGIRYAAVAFITRLFGLATLSRLERYAAFITVVLALALVAAFFFVVNAYL